MARSVVVDEKPQGVRRGFVLGPAHGPRLVAYEERGDAQLPRAVGDPENCAGKLQPPALVFEVGRSGLEPLRRAFGKLHVLHVVSSVALLCKTARGEIIPRPFSRSGIAPRSLQP